MHDFWYLIPDLGIISEGVFTNRKSYFSSVTNIIEFILILAFFISPIGLISLQSVRLLRILTYMAELSYFEQLR